MELCGNKTLKNWLAENKERNYKPIFKELVDAIAYIHSKKLMHRDLKVRLEQGLNSHCN